MNNLKLAIVKCHVALTKINNQKGQGMIEYGLVLGILVLAVIAVQPTIVSTLSTYAGKIQTWLSTKATSLFI